MKTKKILFGLLSIVCFGFSIFTITSCTGNSSDSSSDSITGGIDSTPPDTSTVPLEHVHDWNEIERTSATCTEDGTITYLCIECEETKNIVYKEATGHTEVIDIQLMYVVMIQHIHIQMFILQKDIQK